LKILSYIYHKSYGIVVLLKCPPRPPLAGFDSLYVTVWYESGMRDPSGSVSRKTLKGGRAAFARAAKDLYEG
jgi:hypothetical protein